MLLSGDNYSVPNDYWVFAPYAYINNTNVYNYYAPRTRVRTIILNTTWVRNRYTYNNHSYITGPRREEIQRYTNRPVQVYNINNANRPSRITVNKNTINIYRPAVRLKTNARPARVVDGNAYKQQNPAQRIGGNDNRRGPGYNAANAAKLAAAARNTNPDAKVVRVNDNNGRRSPDNSPANNNRANPATRPEVTGNPQQQQRNIDRQQAAWQQNQVREQQRQVREQQKQQTDQQRQQTEQARQQQKQQTDQQRQQTGQARQQQQQAREQQRQTPEQQRISRPAVNDNAKQQELQQARQARQQQQAREQQRQQADQQRQQQQQARQQQDQQRQQRQQAAPARRPGSK